MPTILVRSILFVSSYFPLGMIFGLLLWEKHPLRAGVIIVGGIICLSLAWVYMLWGRKNLSPGKGKLLEFERKDGEVMSYIATYLIPFVTFSLDTPVQMIALGILVGVLLILYVNSNMIYINPMLNLFGYHLYEVTIEHGKHPYYYIAHKRMIRDDDIDFVYVSDDVLLER
jgi:hypothetical protein